MFRTALTMAAIFLIAVESPAEERSLGVNFVGTVNYPPSPAIKKPDHSSRADIHRQRRQLADHLGR